jgi:PAS domain S-box-containing protein
VSVVETIQVLHVDDEPSFGDLVAEFLERENDRFDVVTEVTPEDGLSLLNSDAGRVDCIVSDYDMPGMDGIAFLDAVREDFPDHPFILYTGKGGEEVASEAISKGATDYLQKGGGTEQYELLANRIENAVEQYRSKQQATNLQRIRTLAANVNQALIRANSAAEIENQLCRLVSESEPYVTACVAEVNRETMRIEPRTWAGEAEGYFGALEMVVDEESPGRHAPEGRAFHDREIAISQNIQDDPRYETWRDAATERGFRSLAVVPLEYGGERHGLLATFAARPNAFDDIERELLVELGENVAHALHARALQTELERTNEELSTILEQAPAGFMMVSHDDGTFRYRRFNRRMEELSGLSSDGIRNKTPQEALGTEDGAKVAERYRECIERGDPVEYTSTFEIGGDDVIRKGTVAPVATGEGTEQLVVVVQDVTEEKQRQHELRRTERRYKAILEDPNILAGVLDSDGTLLEQNQTAMEYIDAEIEDVVGEPFWETPWWPTDIQPVVRENVERAANGEYVEYEADLARPNGDPYTVSGTIRPVTDEDGQVVSLVVSARDITEQEQCGR